ncbi:MAG TPA: putative glycoside hydrolase [Candidatus Paceibacterota bacterium]
MAQGRTKESIRAYRIGVAVLIAFLFLFIVIYAGVPGGDISYTSGTPASVATSAPAAPLIPEVPHLATPPAVKGIYMTSCVAATPSLRDNLVKLIDETEINSVVIDIKSFDGYLSFEPENPDLKHATGGCFVKDMKDFLETLHDHNIYVIGRLASFQDALQVKLRPELAVKKATATSTVWRDHKGIPWIDASARPHWEYLIAVAKDAYAVGFDEVNFDYIRFPSDGNMKDISFPWSGDRKKSEVMRSFFEYIHEELGPTKIVTSADLFGMTTTNTDDLNIGQILEYALPNFDYIAPMVYPSHYPKGFMNFSDPNQHVYEVVNHSMQVAADRTVATTTKVPMPDSRMGTSTLYMKPSFDINKLRPWLQDNNYPVTYTAEMVRAQIQATYDIGLNSWMLWNAGNRYTRAALETATSTDF